MVAKSKRLTSAADLERLIHIKAHYAVTTSLYKRLIFA